MAMWLIESVASITTPGLDPGVSDLEFEFFKGIRFDHFTAFSQNSTGK